MNPLNLQEALVGLFNTCVDEAGVSVSVSVVEPNCGFCTTGESAPLNW